MFNSTLMKKVTKCEFDTSQFLVGSCWQIKCDESHKFNALVIKTEKDRLCFVAASNDVKKNLIKGYGEVINIFTTQNCTMFNLHSSEFLDTELTINKLTYTPIYIAKMEDPINGIKLANTSYPNN